MNFELDQYYTPEDVAKDALKRIDLDVSPRACADTTCGSGRLLDAALSVFGHVSCFGVDRDRNAIAALRRRRPQWTLATGDLLDQHSYARSIARIIPKKTDLLLLNPPFSHRDRKFVDIEYDGKQMKGSIAMAYILRSFSLFEPKHGAVLIVPESLLYSETDATARDALSVRYGLRKVADLNSWTFLGARAHACVVQATASGLVIPPVPPRRSDADGVEVTLNRGCLPVHEWLSVARGVPYLHSTDIRAVIEHGGVGSIQRRASSERARLVTGWVMLLPRVGMPDLASIRAVHLKRRIRLSDCVIAIESENELVALEVEKRIRAAFSSLEDIYRGTGARYITMARLKSWLADRRIVSAVRS